MFFNFKSGIKRKAISFLNCVFLAGTISSIVATNANAVEGKYLPTNDRKLLIIGQDLDSVRAYTNSGYFPAPGGVTNYTNPYDMRGLTDSWNYGSGTMNMQMAMENYPNSALAIGLFMSEASPYDRVNNLTASNGLTEIVNGVYDNNLNRLAQFARNHAPRPIFLRIGYEFDGPWNAYDPQKYQNAYRYIVDFMNNADVDNMAYVWQTSNWGQNAVGRMMDWYPGDNYVDWLGVSFFFYDSNFNGPRFDEMLQIARRVNKPVMIAETSAQYYDFTDGHRYDGGGNAVEYLGDQGIWNQFFVDQLLPFINGNSDVIRAVAWINANWREQEQWRCCSNGFWGDTRIEETQVIRNNWINEITDGTWVNGSPSLLSDLSGTGTGPGPNPDPDPDPDPNPNPDPDPDPQPNNCPSSHPLYSAQCDRCFDSEAQAASANCPL